MLIYSYMVYIGSLSLSLPITSLSSFSKFPYSSIIPTRVPIFLVFLGNYIEQTYIFSIFHITKINKKFLFHHIHFILFQPSLLEGNHMINSFLTCIIQEKFSQVGFVDYIHFILFQPSFLEGNRMRNSLLTCIIRDEFSQVG